jgi:pyruvate kinase
VGAWPIDAVRTMARIIEQTEEHGLERIGPLRGTPRTIGGAVTLAAYEVGDLINAKYLVTFTSTGDSAKRLARFRSKIPMLAFTSSPSTRSQLALVWGIETYLGPNVSHTDEMATQVEQSLLVEGRCVPGDLIIMVAGSPPGIPGSTNMMRVLRIGGHEAHPNPDIR